MHTLKKSLGQHFLKDEKVVEKIIKALLQDSFKNLLEVGPGGGALTRHLVNIPGIHFKAVELDEEKAPAGAGLQTCDCSLLILIER